MSLTAIRHLRPDSAEGLCYGHLDLPPGKALAEWSPKAVEFGSSFQAIVTSPLMRCRTMAEVLSADLALELSVDSRLIEMDFGRWEGRQWADIPTSEIDEWANDFWRAKPHGGECVQDVTDRVQSFVEEGSGQDVLVVTHAGVIRTLKFLAGSPDAWQESIPYGIPLQI